MTERAEGREALGAADAEREKRLRQMHTPPFPLTAQHSIDCEGCSMVRLLDRDRAAGTGGVRLREALEWVTSRKACDHGHMEVMHVAPIHFDGPACNVCADGEYADRMQREHPCVICAALAENHPAGGRDHSIQGGDGPAESGDHRADGVHLTADGLSAVAARDSDRDGGLDVERIVAAMRAVDFDHDGTP